ncbi:MAG: SseB family protein [Frankiaceae bacterium]|nr:SseB family protein [Frankiaceae bacterium]MBV9368679.1 SseB family protein [Frankiales bacterium]
MADLLPGTTPAAPDDDGRIDPLYAAALASGDDATIRAAVLQARLLVPVVALPGADGADAEMSVPALVAADGARALPVFSSYDELRLWRPDARPVPMPGARVILGAAGEGYDGVVVDVAGDHPVTIADDDLRALAHNATAVHRSSSG